MSVTSRPRRFRWLTAVTGLLVACGHAREPPACRSEEHTSELQSQSNTVCRLLLEKKKLRRQRRAERCGGNRAARRRTPCRQLPPARPRQEPTPECPKSARPRIQRFAKSGCESLSGLTSARGKIPSRFPGSSRSGGDLIVAETIGVQLFEIMPRIVDEKFRNIVIPQRECEAAGAAVLIGEVEAVIVVAPIGAAIHVVQAIVVKLPIDRESAGVIVDHVEDDGDA